MILDRAWCSTRIPELFLVESMTEEQLAAATTEGLLHRLLVAADMLLGGFGSPVQDLTISARCALALYANQQAYPSTWWVVAPYWALALGWLLERLDPGHLNAAIRADYARGVRASRKCQKR